MLILAHSQSLIPQLNTVESFSWPPVFIQYVQIYRVGPLVANIGDQFDAPAP